MEASQVAPGESQAAKIEVIEAFIVTIPRDVPYLGPLGAEASNGADGLFIREGNKSVYSLHDHSVLVRVVAEDGSCGWGECVAVVAPSVAAAIITDLVTPLARGRRVSEPVAVHEDLYNAMRVRGFFGGFYLDALAAFDIALWDLHAKRFGVSVQELLGGRQQKRKIRAYVSGLPGSSLEERALMAAQWRDRGFSALKFAAAVAADGEEREIAAIREAVGDQVKILADLHWRYTAPEAVRIIRRLERHGLWLAEAPVAPEDVEGLAQVARAVETPIGSGEELRTAFEFLPRLKASAMDVLQPEMGRTGVTEFIDICRMGRAFQKRVMPHASIGIGIFQAASLQVSAALENVIMHEYQHSIFDKNLRYITGGMQCAQGYFHVPEGPGIGVEPDLEALRGCLTEVSR